MSPPFSRGQLALALVAAALIGGAGKSPASDAEHTPAPRAATYSIEYVVRISARHPTIARVQWNLAGVEEVNRFRIEIDDERHRKFQGSGKIERQGDEILWFPGGPYAHLEYEVRLLHRRNENKGYDSYATRDWVITKSNDLFPATHIDIDLEIEPHPRSRSRVRFRLPRGWKSASAMEELEPHLFRPPQTNKWLDRPRGWIALGRLDRLERSIDGVPVALVAPSGSKFPRTDVLELYEATLPSLIRLLEELPPRLLLVVGPDPMWRGGISGRNSIYLHEERPIRTPDRTSPPIHEAFHVLAPFDPGPDGLWITEGLAEFYSLELQHRAGFLDDDDFRRGLRLFRKWGRWDVNLSDDRSLSVTNNSAPLVIAAIDEWIDEKTNGERSLDDVVREMARDPGKEVTTASFLRIVKNVAEADLTSFVQRHVYAGVSPELRALEKTEPAGPTEGD